MDYRLLLAATGITTTVLIWGLHAYGRKKANAQLLARGAVVEGEVLNCQVHRGRFTCTNITVRYCPAESQIPVTVTRRLEAPPVEMQVGQRIQVRYLPSHPYVSLLVGYEGQHDAS